jgi:hypothetical protein
MKAKLDHIKIRSLLREKKIKQRHLAKKWNKSPQLVSYILNSGSIAYAEMISKVLKVEPKSLIVFTK